MLEKQLFRIQQQISKQRTVLAVVAFLVSLIAVAFVSEFFIQQSPLSRNDPGIDVAKQKTQREIDKLTAEVRQIRSETAGSLFWLKFLGVFVTVGGAIGGYFLAQKETNKERLEFEASKERNRLEFEHRKDVDTAYQAIVQELTDPERPLLRAAAAMKLGSLLQDFPSEWDVGELRRDQLIKQTKQVLATALALEDKPKVRKALTIAVALDRNLQNLDFSEAQAANAYWARRDFTYADFYQANLAQASFREAKLHKAQFWNANLQEAVLAKAECVGTNFKLADLSCADLSHADVTEAIFVDANLQGADLQGAINLRLDQVKCAKNWKQARYGEDFHKELSLLPESVEGDGDDERRG